MKKTISTLLTGVTLLLSGCMGYHLEGSKPQAVKTVFVQPIINQTDEPAVEIQLTQALRKQLQFDGRFRLANTADQADALIATRVTDFEIHSVGFDSDHTTRPDQYRITLRAKTQLLHATTQKVLKTSQTYGDTTFRFRSDLTTTKRDALPRASADLARFIVDDLAETWQ